MIKKKILITKAGKIIDSKNIVTTAP